VVSLFQVSHQRPVCIYSLPLSTSRHVNLSLHDFVTLLADKPNNKSHKNCISVQPRYFR
jgi:hypothetical protein